MSYLETTHNVYKEAALTPMLVCVAQQILFGNYQG